ncbi:MAG: hypothetical protein HKN39_05620 [Flavobacteriales bacterium]|nr:hypothetical protein [Flavobacteriales bacterium]
MVKMRNGRRSDQRTGIKNEVRSPSRSNIGIALLLVALNLFLFNCELISSTITDHFSKGEILLSDTIPFDLLTMSEGDEKVKAFYLCNDALYSGWAVQFEEANDGTWSFVYSIENGVIQRLDVYGINGYRHRYVEMKDGYQHHTVMFHRNGNKYLEQYYDKNKQPLGIWKRWFGSGELEWEKNYGQTHLLFNNVDRP